MLPCHVTLNTRPNMLHTQNSRCVACCDSNDNIAMLIYVAQYTVNFYIVACLCTQTQVYDTAV